MMKFIVLEGIDGCGKGTQAKLLLDRLKESGKDAALTVEPTKGPIGRMIRDHMSNPFLDDESLALLFASDRIEHLQKEVRPAIESGRIVVSDRYVYSSIAYQGQTVDIDWVADINKYADRPDIVFLLDIDPRISEKRMIDRDEAMEIFEEDRNFQEGCRRTFLGFEKGRHLPDSLKTRFVVIDASRGVSEIEMDIWDIVSDNL